MAEMLSIRMTKQIENGQNDEKMGESQAQRFSIENAETFDKDVNEAEESSQQRNKREVCEQIIQGIQFGQVLETIPGEFHSEASEYFHDNDIADTLVTKIIPHWTEEQQSEALCQLLDDNDSGIYADILVKLFKTNEHIECTKSHKRFIEKTFHRFQSVFKHLQEKTILAHDQSKLSFVELIGYTYRWTWGRTSQLWEKALAHHYEHNSHHPQHCLGVQMSPEDLEESVVDMMACHWERKEGGGDKVPAENIAGFSDFYLDRYLPEDRKLVEELLRKIRESGL
eukprot:GFUD01010657.1.p1 GENE.GFUD01010657.1~~GFUD01010657.1.p1  ORF type:complete len:283 (+),score=50.90 GFUD01010657.1:133-981(+)